MKRGEAEGVDGVLFEYIIPLTCHYFTDYYYNFGGNIILLCETLRALFELYERFCVCILCILCTVLESFQCWRWKLCLDACVNRFMFCISLYVNLLLP